jgi:hypothetical protein
MTLNIKYLQLKLRKISSHSKCGMLTTVLYVALEYLLCMLQSVSSTNLDIFVK